MDILGKVKGWARGIIDVGVVAIALSVVLQVLFGGTVPFLGVDVVGNITGLVSSLGSSALHKSHTNTIMVVLIPYYVSYK